VIGRLPVANTTPAPELAPRAGGAETQTVVTAASGDAVPQARPTEAATDAESAPPSWPDEAAESAMVSELRGRGEVIVPSPAAEAVDESDSGALPPLNELVQKIPADVREVLEDLFRARFVTVKRVPKKALK
jgi:hypothetical protein